MWAQGLRPRGVSHSILLVASMIILLGSTATTRASAYFSLTIGSQATVIAPEVVLQNGTAGTSTIYTNNTSAKVSVEAPLSDYVDSNDPDMDSSADKGVHSNFTAQQYGPDSICDTLTEENTEAIEDYVDNNSSDVDGSSDVGTHSNFENQKARDSSYDTLNEQNTRIGEIAKAGTDTSGTDTTSPLGFSHTLVAGSDRLVVISVGVENNGDVGTVSVTYGGQSTTLAVEGRTAMAGYIYYCGIFYILEASLPSEGSQQVSISITGTPSTMEINGFCSEYTGVTQGAPEATDNTDEPSPVDDTIENTISPSTGAWVISAVGCGNVGSFTHGQGQVEVLDFTDSSSAFAVVELRGASGENSLDSTYATGANRMDRVASSWTEVAAEINYELDLEIQFTTVVDFLPTETLCINTGTFSGTEDINVDFWNGTGWENLAADLTAFSCNEYSVSLTSGTFTIRFKDGTTTGDTTQDQWQVDASLLRVEGAGDKEDAVDQQSNVDISADFGTHGNFSALQYGPDAIYDTLIEGNAGGATNTTLIDAESFEGTWPPTGWTETGAWNQEGNQIYDGIYSADFDGPTFGSGSGDLDTPGLNCSDATAIYVSFYFREDVSLTAEYRLSFWNGSSWINIEDLGGYSLGWHNWEMEVTDSQYFTSNFQIRWVANALESGESVYVDLVTVKKEISAPDDYKIELEVQWTNISYSLPNENLSICGGNMGVEDLKVDVWNGTDWEIVFSDLTSGWNNVSIANWLTNSSFTIRFKGGNETGDSSQDIWQIDVALIHVWDEGSESYELDLEVQWTSTDYTRISEELCIRTGSFGGSEDIQVRVWNNTGSSWHWVMNLTASQWNNVSIASYLTSNTLTVQFLGGTETDDTNQDSWNIDATLLHVWSRAWLSGWEKRVKITIDHNDVDSALSDFPVLVYLSNSSSGRNNDDVSFVFDEVGSNRKKIAVTKNDSTTQCYVEIEKWDDASEQAWLWVKVPSIINTSDTDLYLYYDNDHADNTDYVDDTSTGNSVNVWDSYFKMVQHMQDNTTSSTVDSTSNDNDGVKKGAGQPALTTSGKMDGAQNFPSGDVAGGDYIDCGNDLSLQITGYLTMGAWVKIAGSDGEYLGIAGKLDSTDMEGYALVRHSDNRFRFWVGDGTMASADSDTSYTDSDWHYVVGVANNGENYLYVDGVKQQDEDTTILIDSGYWAHIGRQYYNYDQRYWEGIIDEVRISNVSRSTAWIGASYESGRDHLLDFASEESNGTSGGTYDYVLRVNNTATDSWQIRLKKYSDSNISRLQGCTIYLRNSTNVNSTQIVIENGLFNQTEGSWFNLTSLETIYTAITVEANSTGTSRVHIYLEIRVPDTNTYLQYVITYEVT